jgi:signal peptidase I
MNVQVAEAASELIDARLQTGDAVRFTIPTRSMYPALAPGDQVIVRRARAAELRVGDVLIVKSHTPTAWIAHRLIARRVVDGVPRWITKGDQCVTADPPWAESQVIGYVVAAHRQRATAPVDWTSGRARAAGALLAIISRGQAFVAAHGRGATRWIALKASRIFIRASGFIARGIIG